MERGENVEKWNIRSKSDEAFSEYQDEDQIIWGVRPPKRRTSGGGGKCDPQYNGEKLMEMVIFPVPSPPRENSSE